MKKAGNEKMDSGAVDDLSQASFQIYAAITNLGMDRELGLINIDMISPMNDTFLKDWVIFFAALFALPFFVQTLFSTNTSNVLRTTRFSTLFISLAVCLHYPLYLLFVLFIFYLSRWYYRNRFELSYPSFKV